MYAKQTHTRKRTNRSLVTAVKIGVEVILIFLTFRIGGLEAGLLAMAAAGVPTIKATNQDRTEVVIRHD